MRTISEIIKDAGGARSIEKATDGEIKKDAIYKWTSNGVLDRHWPVLIQLAGTTPDELYAANMLIRDVPELAP